MSHIDIGIDLRGFYSVLFEFLRKFTQACLTHHVKILNSGDWVPDFQLMSANKVKLKRFVQ